MSACAIETATDVLPVDALLACPFQDVPDRRPRAAARRRDLRPRHAVGVVSQVAPVTRASIHANRAPSRRWLSYPCRARQGFHDRKGPSAKIPTGRNGCRRSGTNADSAWNGCRQISEGLMVYVGIICLGVGHIVYDYRRHEVVLKKSRRISSFLRPIYRLSCLAYHGPFASASADEDGRHLLLFC